MLPIRAVLFSMFALFVNVPHWGHAQDVTLSSRTGNITFEGALLGFDGAFYRVDTIYGELTVDADGVHCDGPGCPDRDAFVAEMSISGAGAMGRVLLPALIEAFAARNGYEAAREDLEEARVRYVLSDATGVIGRFTIRATTTDEGFADLLADEADVAMSAREIRGTEAVRAREAGLGRMTDVNRSRVLALDGLVAVVAPGHPVTDLSVDTLSRVLSGDLRNWQALGGPDAPIAVHVPAARSGIAQAMTDVLLSPVQRILRAEAIRHDTPEAVSEAVSQDPLALGLTTFANVGQARALTLTGRCGFALSPSRQSIKTEDYPLTQPLFLYMPARRLPALAREFLAFTRTTPAQIVVRRAGFVDQAPEEIALNAQGDRFANAISVAAEDGGLEALQRMVRVLGPRARLTTSFRFETGSSRLDAQSRSNVQQLARALDAGLYDGRELLFVGFSDGEGSPAANREIAARRAEVVRRAVISASHAANLNLVTLGTEAFGAAMPMACDDTAWGRGVNRRVEVWVR